MRKGLIRAWAVVCKDGKTHAEEGVLLCETRGNAEAWVREFAEDWGDTCGPHRIVELIESRRKTK